MFLLFLYFDYINNVVARRTKFSADFIDCFLFGVGKLNVIGLRWSIARMTIRVRNAIGIHGCYVFSFLCYFLLKAAHRDVSLSSYVRGLFIPKGLHAAKATIF